VSSHDDDDDGRARDVVGAQEQQEHEADVDVDVEALQSSFEQGRQEAGRQIVMVTAAADGNC
jgi:hypothetical protein